MTARRPLPSKKFVLNLRNLRAALVQSEATAAKAVAAGKQAVKKAKQARNAGAFIANQTTLAKALKAQENLAISIELLENCCDDQFLNCDPRFV